MSVLQVYIFRRPVIPSMDNHEKKNPSQNRLLLYPEDVQQFNVIQFSLYCALFNLDSSRQIAAPDVEIAVFPEQAVNPEILCLGWLYDCVLCPLHLIILSASGNTLTVHSN